VPRPNSRDKTTDPATFFGHELKLLRQAAGFDSQESLAAAMRAHPSVISKAEQGRRVPTEAVLHDWLEACRVVEPWRGLYERLAVLASSTDRPVPTWFENWLELEAQAHTLRIWQPLIIPGPFQTASYARALFTPGADADKLDEMVAARMARQVIFERADPPHIVVVLDEMVLRRMIGSPVVMAEALDHMVELADRPNISVHILPSSENGANAGLSGGFFIASVDGRPDVVILEAVEDQTTDNRPLVRKSAIGFDHVRGDALPRAASRTLILEAAEKWKTH
jgi:transcriptional regulator with XRE-family HTH domain